MPAWELRSAFPASLAMHANRVAVCLGPPGATPSVDAFHVVVDGEELTIPGRIYFDTGWLAGSEVLPAVERLILMCIFTRHHDGHVREDCVRAIVGHTEPWVAPFVVQLLGEYVLEIVEVIKSNLPALGEGSYARFVAANPAFMAVTRQRAISYWNCYFRRRFPNRTGFASLEVLDRLEALATSNAAGAAALRGPRRVGHRLA